MRTNDETPGDAHLPRIRIPMAVHPDFRSATPNAYTTLNGDRWSSINYRPEIVEPRVDEQNFSRHTADAPGYRTWSGKRLSPAPGGESGLHMHVHSRRQSITSLSDGRKPTGSRDSPVPQGALPPFASFSQHPGYPDEPDGPEIAPMSQRIACSSCTNLKPLVRDVAVATADLEGCVQAICNTTVTRMSKIPADNSLKRTAHWILDRLRYAKIDLQESHKRRSYSDTTPAVSLQSASSLHSLKRIGQHDDQNDPKSGKRLRFQGSPEQQASPGLSSAPYSTRRMSLDIDTGKDQFPQIAYSPPRSESAVGVVQDGNSSPRHRAMRSLPSPAPSAYILSGSSSSLPPSTVKPSGSPDMSFRSNLSSQMSSSDFAASAHLADLQHQVALKSHALENLQSEYALLSQKLHNDTFKSHTIDTKPTFTGQAPTGLSSKNQELSELVKGLEAHIKSLEAKREEERADAAKDKEQWSKMLDMSSRIQARQAEQCQKLKNEKDDLIRRFSHQAQSSLPTSLDNQSSVVPRNMQELNGSTSSPAEDPVVLALKREVQTLTTRNSSLRESLEKLENHSVRIHKDTQNLMNTIQQAVSADDISGAQYLVSTTSTVEQDYGHPTKPWQHLPISPRDEESVVIARKSQEMALGSRSMPASVAPAGPDVTELAKVGPHGRYTTSASGKSVHPAQIHAAPVPQPWTLSPPHSQHKTSPSRSQEQRSVASSFSTLDQASQSLNKASDHMSTSLSTGHNGQLHLQSSHVPAVSSPNPARPETSPLLDVPTQASPASHGLGSQPFSPINERSIKQEKQTSMLPPPRPNSSPHSAIDGGI
nr:hypothetical protein CFP56_09234 [Quercus suber]